MSQIWSSGTGRAVGCVAGAELAGTAPTAMWDSGPQGGGDSQGWVVQGGHSAGVASGCWCFLSLWLLHVKFLKLLLKP